MSANRLGWHHLCVEIPDAWEVIGYGTQRRDGRLLLSDPRGETLQVHWKTLKRAPNLRNRLQAWKDTVPHDGGVRFREVGSWAVCEVDDGPLLAARHDAGARILLTMAFSAHAREDAGAAGLDAILRSYRENCGERRTWAAFGIDVTLPGDWELDSVEAWPAAQRLHFSRRRGERVSVHRYGMLPVLLAGDTDEAFYARMKGASALLRVEGPWGKGLALSYQAAQSGLMNVFRGTSLGLAWLWRESGLERLYVFDQKIRGQQVGAEPVGEVRCR
ncbi:MAG: hypothetical protein WCH98_16970 [Verrucomicrobiota bacterium]